MVQTSVRLGLLLILFFVERVFTSSEGTAKSYDCSEPPPDVFMDTCCEFPTLYDEQTYKNCWTHWQTRGVLNLIVGGGISGGAAGCVAECFFNQTGVFDGDSIDLYKLTEMVSRNVPFNNPYFDVVMTALEKCVDQANMRRPRFLLIKNSPDIIMNRKNCNPISGYTLTCISMHILTNCPKSERKYGKGCDDYIGYFSYCNSPI